jgi:hypothetical protein
MPREHIRDSRLESEFLFRTLQRLSDADFEQFVRAERKRRRQAAWLFKEEQGRGRFRRGLSRGDQLEVMRRSERSWEATP